MSEIKQVKDAVQEAKNDLEKEKQEALKNKVKSIIRATLEKIEKEEEIVKEHQDKVSILRKDLKDLETGRLDLIEERQSKDPVAKSISVVIVKKVERLAEPIRFHGYQPWYWPFELIPQIPIYNGGPDVWTTYTNAIGNATTCGGTSTATAFASNTVNDLLSDCITMTGSSLSSFVPGTYNLDSGATIDIRPRF